ncbi:MAG TPA: LamG-like jellyroll fold domain-containing protein, partial [Solirubrobacteraceae bacterium]|nr:LamG-like jellyroll fold domain-containing protein [Solirubrobacteraceae bacterium]
MRGLLRLVPIIAALAVVGFPAAAWGSQCPDAVNAPDVCSPEIRVPLDSAYAAEKGPATGAYVGHASTYPAQGSVGDLYGNWISTTPGRFNNAFTFNGFGNGLTWDLGGSGANHDRMSPAQVTEALWVKARNRYYTNSVIAVRGSRDADGLTGDPCTAYGGAWGLVTGENGGIQFYVTLENQFSFDGVTVVRTPEVSADQVFDRTWHAVAGVFDGGRPGSGRVISLWIDGRQAAAQDLPRYLTDGRLSYPYDPTGSGNDELMIAGPSDNQAQNCGGYPSVNLAASIDEVEIFDHALTAPQLATLQNAGATTPPDVPYTPYIQGPSLTGTPQVGQALTCTDRDGLTNRTFTWERAPRDTHFENDSSWTAIDGATGTTYTVKDADAGSRLRCHEYGRFQSDSAGAGYWNADRASTSLRADHGAPVNVSPPYITGDATADPKYGPYGINPLAGHYLVCNPGSWTNGPEESAGDFYYQWVRNGTAIQGANGKYYTLTRSYDRDLLVDAHGDAGKFIECLVYAHNDVGGAAPVVSSNGVRAIDGAPWLVQRPHVVLSALPPGDANPLHRHVDCINGIWRDDYAAYGIEPFHYRFSWYRKRGGTYEQIAGATDSRYQVAPEDLGRALTCNVITGNPAGENGVRADNEVLVELPTGTVDSELFRDGGRNGADPTNLMAISGEYKKAIDALVLSRLKDGVTKATQACQDGSALPPGTTIPPGVPGLFKPRPNRPVKIGQPPPDNQVNTTRPIRGVDRCRVLLHAPNSVWYLPTGGVRYNVGGCRKIDEQMDLGTASASDFTCPSLGIEVPSIDPSQPPQLPADVKALESVTPKEILWDLNGDGRVDAICPGTAPVLRTIYNPGTWNPRAVIITDASAQTGRFSFAGGPQDEFTTPGDNNQQPGTLRGDQVMVCATSFDPPPDPNHGPCVTNASIGRVNVTGNLCPIDVRAIDPNDYSTLLGKFPQVRQLLFAASEDRLRHEGALTARNRLASGPIVWADWGPQ